MNKQLTRRGAVATTIATTIATAGPAALGVSSRRAHARPVAVIGSNAPPGTPWHGQWLRFAANTEALGIDVTPMIAGELGSDETILTALRRDRVQVGGFMLTALAGVVPELAILNAPYLLPEGTIGEKFDAVATEIFAPLLRAQNLVLLGWTASGWAGLYATRPLRRPEDVAGRRMRAAPALPHRAFLDALDADVVPLGLADVVPALQAGLIEGGAMVLTYYAASLADAAKYFTQTHHHYEGGAVVANAAWFDRLDSAQQRGLREAYDPPAAARAEIAAHERALLRALAAQGVTVTELTTTERDRWRTASAGAAARLVAEIGGDAQAILARLQAQ